ncbi:MAG: hypothetical protein GTO17_10355 [Candidatus Aminicenantes bacterium]|nr:hypothetical protein [Candidatus Aminicenantes bacterium]
MKLKNYSFLFILIIISVLLSFCASKKGEIEKEWTPEEVEKKLKAEHEDLRKLFLEGNAEEMAKLFGEYGIIWPSEDEMISGLENLAKFWAKVMESDVTDVTFESMYVFVKNEEFFIAGERYDFFAFDIGKCHLITEEKEGEKKNQTLSYLRGRRHHEECWMR